MELQVVQLQDVLPVGSVTYVPGLSPPSVELKGPDFRSVEQVLINDAEAPEVIAVDSSTLLVQLPATEATSVVRTVSVLSSRFTRSEASRIRFRLSLNPKEISGLERMMQTFLITFLTTPGTDAWSPSRGGGAQKIVGANFPKDTTGGVVAEFAVAVSRTRSQVIAMQSRSSVLSNDERLAGAEILESYFNTNSLGLVARIKLTARSGRSAIANLEV